jgi:hypothetical protein
MAVCKSQQDDREEREREREMDGAVERRQAMRE